MAKIRDLGISAIPATMRPPEVGAGGAPRIEAGCKQPSGTPRCDDNRGASGKPDDVPRKGPGPGCEKSNAEQKYARHLDAGAVARLRQQLDEAAARQYVN